MRPYAMGLGVAAVLAIAASAASTSVPWGPVVRQSLPAVVAVEAGRVGWADLYTRPSWFGTGYLLALPQGGTRLITAAHLAADLDGGRWYLWRAIGLRADRAPGWVMGAFTPQSTQLYPFADTAESAAIPPAPGTSGSACPSLGTCPAVTVALPLGHWRRLRIGEPVAVLGNPQNHWLAQGDHALLQTGYFLGMVPHGLEVSEDPHFPTVRLPLALDLYLRSCAPGDSGSPVLTLDGSVVGTLTACGDGTGFAVPLSYPGGTPVGEPEPVPVAGYAPQGGSAP
jgi:hypothetical protein